MKLQFEQQRLAFDRIERLTKIFFSRSWIKLPVTPRLIPLICGPTGAGKTQVVKELAASMDLPLLRLTYANWVPRSYRGEPTVPIIMKFMTDNERGIIHIDEVDKLTPSGEQSFNDSIKIEVFNLLDRLIYPQGAPEKAQNFMIVASGTWQDLWEGKAGAPIGFNTCAVVGEGRSADIDQQTTIPPELMNRFNRELIHLQYPSGPEVVAAAQAISAHFPHIPFEPDRVLGQYEMSKRGCRWFEEYATGLLDESFDVAIVPCSNAPAATPYADIDQEVELPVDLDITPTAELEPDSHGCFDASVLLNACMPIVETMMDQFQSFFDDSPCFDSRVSGALGRRFPLLRALRECE